MIKLIAFDLDETLLCSDKSISKENKAALHKAKEKGIKIVPASGRGPCMLQDIYDALDIYEQGQYSILCNGGCIVDNYTNEVLICHTINDSMIIPLIEFGLKKDLNIQIFTCDHIYCYNTDEEEKEVIHLISKGHPDYPIFKEDLDFTYLKDIQVIKMLYQKKDMNYLQSLKKELDWTSSFISISYSSNRYLELNPLHIDKGKGLEDLVSLLSMDIKDTLAIGDSYNDYEMIEKAGIGAVVNNGIDKCKAIADYISPFDHNHNGVREILEKFIL
ncbi:MAG: Cof-type HAD-IIB family hydrolase [Holdemanella sp.]|nr:Cof-type HAD-IIB family hydrolase [Holdemanella sp.]